MFFSLKSRQPFSQEEDCFLCPHSRYILLGMVVCLVLITQIPLFDEYFIPTHDNMNRFSAFFSIYSNFSLEGELALWSPHANYGIPFFFVQFNIITPSLALLGTAGWLLGVENVLTLFKLSMVLDSLFFALSMLLLTEHLLPHSRLARCLVLFGAILTSSWMEQPFLNFYVYYALPLVIYLLLRYIDEKRIGFFWGALLVELVSFFGNVAYFAPIHFWGLLLLFLPTLWQNPRLLLPLFGKKSFIMMVGFVVVTVIMVYFAVHSLDHLSILTHGRQASDGNVSIRNFLNFGRGTMTNTFAGLTTGGFLHYDNTFYMGLLPLALFFYGLFVIQHPIFLGLVLNILFLLMLSVGGHFASVMYSYLPGINLFRHVGMVYGIIKILLLPAVGLVVQDILLKQSKRTVNKANWVLLALLLCIFIDIGMVWRPYDHLLIQEKSEFMRGVWWLAFSIRLLLYGMALAWIWRQKQWAMGILLLVFFVDVATFQAQVLVTAPMSAVELPAETFLRRTMTYLPSRQKDLSADTVPNTILKATLHRDELVYNHEAHDAIYSFAGVDVCYSLRSTLLFSDGVLEMIRMRGGTPYHFTTPEALPWPDEGFIKALGCESNKFFATRWVTIATNRQEAADLFAQLDDPSRQLVLLAGRHPLAKFSQEKQGDNPLVNITVKMDHFSANRLVFQVESDDSRPFWLHYADASHPGWRATVNGKEVPIAISQFALKAIPLQGKHNSVTLEFRPGLMGSLAWLTAIFALLAGIGMVLIMARIVVSQKGQDSPIRDRPDRASLT